MYYMEKENPGSFGNRDFPNRFSFRISDYLYIVCIYTQISKYKGYNLISKFFPPIGEQYAY